ncbi:MAG: hypothetical protein RLZZ385_186 [Pseudomonadota bacterium]|jgi:uncharacterized membrane protein YfcA
MELAIAVAAVLLGSYIQSSIGFGLAIIAAPVLYFLDPAYVPAPVTVCAFTLSLANAWSHRRAISLRGLQYAIIGRIPGSVAGALLLLWIDQRLLGMWLGVSVLGAVLLSLRTIALAPTTGHLLTAGFLSGFMGTSSSIGGPPMALVMQHQDADYIRANLSAFFIVSCLMSLAMLIPIGRFGLLELQFSLPLLPATLLGFWLARYTWHHISKRNLRLFSLLLCSVSGVLAIVSYWI